MRLRLITGLALALAVSSAHASIVTVHDWSYVEGVGDTGTTLFRVTETFTSKDDLGGISNLYEYQVENLSDYTAELFRIANPDDFSRTMTGPTEWDARDGAQNFLWETLDDDNSEGHNIEPGEILGGFQIFTPGLIPDLTFDSFGVDGAGWILARDTAGTRIDIFGEVVRTTTPVPVPPMLVLFATGLLILLLSGRVECDGHHQRARIAPA